MSEKNEHGYLNPNEIELRSTKENLTEIEKENIGVMEKLMEKYPHAFYLGNPEKIKQTYLIKKSDNISEPKKSFFGKKYDGHLGESTDKSILLTKKGVIRVSFIDRRIENNCIDYMYWGDFIDEQVNTTTDLEDIKNNGKKIKGILKGRDGIFDIEFTIKDFRNENLADLANKFFSTEQKAISLLGDKQITGVDNLVSRL